MDVGEGMNHEPIVLSEDEVAELYRFTRNDYVNPNTYPALTRLLARLEKRVAHV